MDKNRTFIQSDLPVEAPRSPLSEPAVPKKQLPSIHPDIFRRLEIIETDVGSQVNFHGGSQKRSGLKLALWTWFSAAIDTLVLVSTCCFFIVLSSFFMKASPTSMVALFFKNQNVFFVIGILFLVSMWSYLIFMRAYMGASIGEWTCDLRLGEPLQRLHLSYVFRVLIRTTIILLTGIIVLPGLSLLFSRDFSGEISGIKIYSLE